MVCSALTILWLSASLCLSLSRICCSAQPSCWSVGRLPGDPEHGIGVKDSWMTGGASLAAWPFEASAWAALVSATVAQAAMTVASDENLLGISSSGSDSKGECWQATGQCALT